MAPDNALHPAYVASTRVVDRLVPDGSIAVVAIVAVVLVALLQLGKLG